MTKKNKFPSLNKKLFKNKDMDHENHCFEPDKYDGSYNDYWYSEEDVEEYCRDIQEIEEIIDQEIKNSISQYVVNSLERIKEKLNINKVIKNEKIQ